jgi:2-oxoisovalerate dehydrogenase E1 component
MYIEKTALFQTPLLDTDFKPGLDYLNLLMLSRESDVRESILFRQGRGSFCLPSAGHENMAALSLALRPTDTIFCHYRDRAMLLARGQSIHDIALGFFAKAGSSSEGRQLSSHFSDPDHNIVSCASPIASQCLPAAGMAWSAKLNLQDNVVVCCLGEAGIREGEFYEAWCFAIQEQLPIIFVIEDNGYGISTPTEKFNPLRLGVFALDRVHKVNGRIATEVYDVTLAAAERARSGDGPSILWLSFDRLMAHTSSDDQKIYRSGEELNECYRRDPITLLRDELFAEDQLNAEEWDLLQKSVSDFVSNEYERAEQAPDPDMIELLDDVRSKTLSPFKNTDYLDVNQPINMAQAINRTFDHLLSENRKIILFGQDIADPKGGVFGLTKGLSTKFASQVFNAPLAEATICGLAAGLALAGHTPVFELQFIDFMATGFNQIVNQIATMRWRTAGGYKCPLILLAPCGGYTHGGGPWHTQTNEALFAHTPGLNVCMPSSAQDAANFILHAAYGNDPTLILLPKNLFFKDFNIQACTELRHDSANVLREGNDVTIVAWGNCVELALQAAELSENDNISAEVIDLKSIVPCDMQTVTRSLEKTGRIVIVHEDNKTCSFGQSLIAQIVSNKLTWDMLSATPQLVCRDDVLVPFNVSLAKQVLPSTDKIVQAVKKTLAV